MLGLHCCAGFSLVAVSGGYSLAVVCRLLIAVASPVAEHGALGSRTSVAVVHGLSCPKACRNFEDQGSKLWPPALGGQSLNHYKQVTQAAGQVSMPMLTITLERVLCCWVFFPISLGKHHWCPHQDSHAGWFFSPRSASASSGQPWKSPGDGGPPLCGA